MIVSFFSHTEYTTWIDYSRNPDCLYQEDIDFDPTKQTIELLEDWGEFSIEVSDIPEPPETDSEKKIRKVQEFVLADDIDEFDWEWVFISPEDYSRLIILRDFEGDNGAQQAMLAKTDMKHLAMFKALWVPVDTLKTVYADEIAKLTEISMTRVAIGLNPFDLSFLDE